MSSRPARPPVPVKDRRIEEVIEEFSLGREEVLYVGDAPSDVKACRDCRIRIAAAAWAPTASIRELEEMHPDFVFTSVADFFDFLRRKLEPEDRPPDHSHGRQASRW